MITWTARIALEEPTLDPGAVGVVDVEGWVQNPEDHLEDILS